MLFLLQKQNLETDVGRLITASRKMKAVEDQGHTCGQVRVTVRQTMADVKSNEKKQKTKMKGKSGRERPEWQEDDVESEEMENKEESGERRGSGENGES